MGIVVRILGADYPILQVSVLRNLFGIIPALILLSLGPGVSSIKKINTPFYWKLIVLRGVVVLLAQYCFYTALTKIEFATASALGFTSPLFITLLSIPILGHKVGFFSIICSFFWVFGCYSYFSAFQSRIYVLAGFTHYSGFLLCTVQHFGSVFPR